MTQKRPPGQSPGTQTMRIDRIRVGRRFRRDLGDLDTLAASIRERGLERPVVVDARGNLVCGQRRLLACKQLGWAGIPVLVRDLDGYEALRLQLEEDATAKPLSEREKFDLVMAVVDSERKRAAERRAAGLKRGGKALRSGKLPEREKGETRDRIGVLMGVSGKTAAKALAIGEAVREEPAKYAHLMEVVNRTGKWEAAHSELARAKKKEAWAALPPAPVPEGVQLLQGDAESVLKKQPPDTVHCVVTSPAYWNLRDYGGEPGQLGLERTPEKYVERLVRVFREVRRVLRPDGTVWLVLGDCYAGSGKGASRNGGGAKESYVPDPDGPAARIPKVPPGLKPKDLVGIPWMVAFALRADGWWLRSENIWAKGNKAKPRPDLDRPTTEHETIFLLTKAPRDCFIDEEAMREATVSGEGTRNLRTVWDDLPAVQPGWEGHPAPFPVELAARCIRIGCPPGGTVLDPYIGSGTTAAAARRLGRTAIGIDLSAAYLASASRRLAAEGLRATAKSVPTGPPPPPPSPSIRPLPPPRRSPRA